MRIRRNLLSFEDRSEDQQAQYRDEQEKESVSKTDLF